MKQYVPENTQRNRVRGYRAGDLFWAAVIVGSVLVYVLRDKPPSQKEAMAIERQVEILKIQQQLQSLDYNAGVQEQQTRGLINATDALEDSIHDIKQQAEK